MSILVVCSLSQKLKKLGDSLRGRFRPKWQEMSVCAVNFFYPISRYVNFYAFFPKKRRSKPVLSLQIVIFYFFRDSFLYPGPVGLDWNKLKNELNPNFEWEAAVKAALKTEDSLEDVSSIFLPF